MLDILPVELIDLSLSSLTPTELAAMGPLNRQFHSISSRILYKSLDLSNGQSVRCLRTLSRSPSLASLVRSLHLDWSDLGSPLPALLVLLHRVLLGLTNLNSLILELAVKHVGMGTSWVLRDCKFDLKLFISSIRCDQLLAQFLESQPNLVELGLRGFGNPDLFALSPTSLPHLQSLRAMRAGPLVFRSVVQGRPIENVSVGLVPCDGFTALDVLDLSTKSIKRLTIMTFNFSTPESILTEISRRMPSLVALHVVALNTRPLPTEQDSPLKWSTLFTPFTRLRHFTFMSSSMKIDDEIGLVTEWTKHCPSLATVVLPRGKVLVAKDGKWFTVA